MNGRGSMSCKNKAPGGPEVPGPKGRSEKSAIAKRALARAQTRSVHGGRAAADQPGNAGGSSARSGPARERAHSPKASATCRGMSLGDPKEGAADAPAAGRNLGTIRREGGSKARNF